MRMCRFASMRRQTLCLRCCGMFTDAGIALMASLEYNRVLVHAHIEYNNIAAWVVRSRRA